MTARPQRRVSGRFAGAEFTEWRSRLIARYARLFPDAKLARSAGGDGLTSVGWPHVGDGWRDVVECLCGRLDAVAVRAKGSVSIIGIDEKYAELRIDIATMGLTTRRQAEAELAVDLAEARSIHVFEMCGDRGGLWTCGGWLSARCDRHGEGKPLRAKAIEIQRTFRVIDGHSVVDGRRYDFDSDSFVPVDLTSEEYK